MRVRQIWAHLSLPVRNAGGSRAAGGMTRAAPAITLLAAGRAGARAGWRGGRGPASPAGRSAVSTASSVGVRDANVWLSRASSSSLASMPRTYAALSTSITCSRSACEARKRPRPPAAATSSPGPVITGASPEHKRRHSVTRLPAGSHPRKRHHHPGWARSRIGPVARTPTGAVVRSGQAEADGKLPIPSHMTSVVSLTMTLAVPYGLLGTFATRHARPAVRRTATGTAISVLIALAVPPRGRQDDRRRRAHLDMLRGVIDSAVRCGRAARRPIREGTECRLRASG